jgi:hypothetical protein
METCINYCTMNCAYVSSDEQRWKTRIWKLAEQYPDEVRVLAVPEKNDGCIYATVPIKWVRIQPPKKMNFTEEQRQKSAERMRSIHRNTPKQDVCIEI